MPKKQKTLSLELRVSELEQELSITKDRLLQTERALRIIGKEFIKSHLSEDAAKKWAARANSLSNTMREVLCNLKKHGNEFDNSPHYISEKD